MIIKLTASLVLVGVLAVYLHSNGFCMSMRTGTGPNNPPGIMCAFVLNDPATAWAWWKPTGGSND